MAAHNKRKKRVAHVAKTGPQCPMCNRRAHDSPTGIYWCENCRMMFDSDPNEGSPEVYDDPSSIAYCQGKEAAVIEQYRRGSCCLYRCDCIEVMETLDASSVDSVITDPPYGLSFMGRDWDHGVPGVAFWEAAMRACKPGATLLAFGGTRTFHRLTCAIEDAGWEIRDCIMWVYGQGFPKSHDISAAIDKAAGAEREVVAVDYKKARQQTGAVGTTAYGNFVGNGGEITLPATESAHHWNGWGSALKPAWEPIIVAMKPLDGTYAENALNHGVAGLNIDGCRVPIEPGNTDVDRQITRNIRCSDDGWGFNNCLSEQVESVVNASGRWPANVIHDGSDDVLSLFPQTESGQPAGTKSGGQGNAFGHFNGDVPVTGIGDSGSAARFFYCAKASPSERTMGGRVKNGHPTVKPLELMRYLCRMTKTPTGGIVLDPFMGSGTTGVAAFLEGRGFVGMEKDADSFETAKSRIEAAMDSGRQELLF